MASTQANLQAELREDSTEDPIVIRTATDDELRIDTEKRIRALELIAGITPRSSCGKADQRVESLQHTIEEFARNTTMHGAPRVILAETPIKRTIWLSVFIVCWIMFVYQTILVCRNYLTYPKRTDIEIINKEPPFPAVTFCNNRGVSFYNHEAWRKKEVEATLNRDLALYNSLDEDLYSLDPAFRSEEWKSLIRKSSIPKEELFLYFRMNTGFESIEGLDQLTIKEIDGGRRLKCYTVTGGNLSKPRNHQIKSLKGFIMTGGGMVSKSTIEEDYLWKKFHNKNGIEVYIHQAGIDLRPDWHGETSVGYSLKPNYRVEFRVKVKEVVRLGQPHGNCLKENPYSGSNGSRTVLYRSVDCESRCYNALLSAKDKWISAFYPPPANMTCRVATTDEHSERWCSTSTRGKNGNQTKAQIHSPQIDPDNCACYTPCEETEYDISPTYSSDVFEGNEDFYFEMLFTSPGPINIDGKVLNLNYSSRFLCHNETNQMGECDVREKKFKFIENYLKRNDRKQILAENVVYFEIHSAPNQVVRTTESPLYTPTQLISEIGGQLGVWIGVSVITAVEVLELILKLLRNTRLRRNNERQI